MTKPTKAAVIYSTGSGESAIESTLQFHAVMAEDHDVEAEVTGYPAQNGFVVSNHSIIKNRKVTITGAVTDTPIAGTDTAYQFGLDNKKVAFGIMNDLVRSSTPCKVVTNLGTYYPVIFKKFKTRTDKDWTNAIKFTFMGEEIQQGTSKDSSTPAPVNFSVISDTEREARIQELLGVGVEVPDSAIISTAQVDFGASFSLDTFNPGGDPMSIVYEHIGTDPDTLANTFMIHTSDIAVAIADVADNAITTISTAATSILSELPDNSLAAGAKSAASCMIAKSANVASQRASGYINTANGYLKESIYGAHFGITQILGNSGFGQLLAGLGADCNIISHIGAPILDDLLEPSGISTGNTFTDIAKIASGSQALPSFVTTLTRVSSADRGQTTFFGDLI